MEEAVFRIELEPEKMARLIDQSRHWQYEWLFYRTVPFDLDCINGVVRDAGEKAGISPESIKYDELSHAVYSHFWTTPFDGPCAQYRLRQGIIGIHFASNDAGSKLVENGLEAACASSDMITCEAGHPYIVASNLVGTRKKHFYVRIPKIEYRMDSQSQKWLDDEQQNLKEYLKKLAKS